MVDFTGLVLQREKVCPIVWDDIHLCSGLELSNKLSLMMKVARIISDWQCFSGWKNVRAADHRSITLFVTKTSVIECCFRLNLVLFETSELSLQEQFRMGT
jgi:hypothetical protein